MLIVKINIGIFVDPHRKTVQNSVSTLIVHVRVYSRGVAGLQRKSPTGTAFHSSFEYPSPFLAGVFDPQKKQFQQTVVVRETDFGFG